VVAIGGVANPREQAELQRWIDATTAVLRSPEFSANLRSLAGVYQSVFHDGGRNQPRYVTINDLAAMLEGRGAFRYVPVAVALSGGEGFFGGLTGWTGFTEADKSQSGSMTLYRGDLRRWRSNDRVEQSCAINTLAHEITHTIASDARLYIQAVTDFHRFDAVAGRPAASYLVGTVAQCTWLQQQGRVTPAGLRQCVTVFGTRHFNSGRCSSFAAGQPVEVRVGLPPEATDREMDNRPPPTP
jgi:hypothetical protein